MVVLPYIRFMPLSTAFFFIPVLNGEGNVLQSALLFLSKLPGLFFTFERRIIRKHIRLFGLLLRNFLFWNQIAGRYVYTANQQFLMHYAIIYI